MTAQSELSTAALRSSQATHAAVDNSQHHLLGVPTLGTGSICVRRTHTLNPSAKDVFCVGKVTVSLLMN